VFVADITLVWVGGILVVGFLGFFVVAIASLSRLFSFVFRAITGVSRPANAARAPAAESNVRACPRPRCGYLNRPEARYCARCGSQLDAEVEVDHYG